jgi:hypothetical protein
VDPNTLNGKKTKTGAAVDEFVRAQEEIRQGNFVLAETLLDTILYRSDEITSHLLFDLTSAYEELFTATDRYEDLICISRQCVERARHLPELDMQIHSAHAMLVVAGAEIALGRKGDAERNIHAAQRSLERFHADVSVPTRGQESIARASD